MALSGAEELDAADAALARMDVDGVVAHLSAALRAFTAAEDPCAAALVCTRLGQVTANFFGNQTAGRAWFARAERLVADLPPCLEQGWVAVAAMGCDVDDPDELLARAELALDRARRFGDLNLETKALADAGLAHVESGRIDEGMGLLDEAMALACGPADDDDVAARSVCSFFTACYYAVDFDRASSWSDQLRRHGLVGPTPGSPLFLSSHCDSVQAALLMELGRWTEAEALLLAAKAEFETSMGPSWHPDIGLANLRIRQGRYAEAEALLVGKDGSIEALLPSALLHHRRGDHALARRVAERGIRAVGTDHLRACDLLAVLVDAHLADGDVATASTVAEELERRVAAVDVPALAARCDATLARVAAGEGLTRRAVGLMEDAIDRVDPVRLPVLRMRLCLQLAELKAAAGDEEGAARAAGDAAALRARLDIGGVVVERAPDRDETTAPAVLRDDGGWWTVSWSGTSARLRASKGLQYLAVLVEQPGVERHALDLVDRVEGVGVDGDPDRRRLGDAGEVLDGRARTAYRHRIEGLRSDIDEALAAGRLEEAEGLQAEIDQLVVQLSQAFGLDGRARVAGSAAERARLNVTRALRGALVAIDRALPGAGAALDRRVRTGAYCAYEPERTDVPWIVQRGVNGTGAD